MAVRVEERAGSRPTPARRSSRSATPRRRDSPTPPRTPSESFNGQALFGGVDVGVAKWLAVAGEVQYRRVPNAHRRRRRVAGLRRDRSRRRHRPHHDRHPHEAIARHGERMRSRTDRPDSRAERDCLLDSAGLVDSVRSVADVAGRAGRRRRDGRGRRRDAADRRRDGRGRRPDPGRRRPPAAAVSVRTRSGRPDPADADRRPCPCGRWPGAWAGRPPPCIARRSALARARVRSSALRARISAMRCACGTSSRSAGALS